MHDDGETSAVDSDGIESDDDYFNDPDEWGESDAEEYYDEEDDEETETRSLSSTASPSPGSSPVPGSSARITQRDRSGSSDSELDSSVQGSVSAASTSTSGSGGGASAFPAVTSFQGLSECPPCIVGRYITITPSVGSPSSCAALRHDQSQTAPLYRSRSSRTRSHPSRSMEGAPEGNGYG